MEVGLFIPCYVNQFYPAVAIATMKILERLDLRVSFPLDQTCCGQPMANSGFEHLSVDCMRNFAGQFEGCEYIVCPSGSCTLHLREYAKGHALAIGKGVFELTEFLVDVLKVVDVGARFPYRVAMHQSCHGQRGLGLAQMSEVVAPPFSKPERLLRAVDGLQLVELWRPDECCGFGGTLAVFEEAVSVAMGRDRIEDFVAHDAEYIVGGDMSCLMHLQGLISRSGKKIPTIHIAEILNSR